MTSSLPLRVVLCLQLTLTSVGFAQYRPPPMSDAERLIGEGDELRVDAAKAASFGETDRAKAKLDEAVQAYEKALAADPNAIRAAKGLGLACSTLKDWDKLITVVTPHQARTPTDPDLAQLLGVALLKKKRYAESVPLLEVAAAAKRQDLFIVHYYLGWLALQRGEGTATVAQLGQYLKDRPKEVAANDQEIQVLLGKGHLLLKDARSARTAFEAAQAGQPENVNAQLGLVQVLELEGKGPQAVALLEGLVTRFRKAPEPKERLARALVNGGNARRAEALTLELLAIQDTASGHLLMADVQLALKQLPSAEREYKAALKRAPGLLVAHAGLAAVVQAQGRHEEAISGLVSAIAAAPDQPQLIAVLGSVYRRAGRVDQAISTHQELLRLTPQGPSAHLLLGADYFAGAKWDSAISAYSTVLEREPGHRAGRHWLAAALLRRAKVRTQGGLIDDATRDLKQSFELERNVLTARGLGALLLTRRQFAEAKLVMAEATGLPGATWREHLLLGWAQLGAEDAAGATDTFEAAAALAKEPEAQSQVGAGWALARLEAGDLEAALKRLGETKGQSSAAAENLPLARLRRALTLLSKGEVADAQADFEEATKPPLRPALEPLTELTRGLIAIEAGRMDPARLSFQKAVPAADKSPTAVATRAFLDSYLEYRRDRPAEARKKLTAAIKASDAATWAQYGRAISRREGELLYFSGAMPRAEAAFKAAALTGEPFNSFVVHNLACVQYRKGGAASAVATWRALVGAVPEASLNLGIASQVQSKDMQRAARYYGQYLGTRGSYLGLAREWKDRIEAIYGSDKDLGDPQEAGGEKTTTEGVPP